MKAFKHFNSSLSVSAALATQERHDRVGLQQSEVTKIRRFSKNYFHHENCWNNPWLVVAIQHNML